jgi:hypothetical protein
VQAKITKLVGLKNGGRVSLINLVTFAGTQNGEYSIIGILRDSQNFGINDKIRVK